MRSLKNKFFATLDGLVRDSQINEYTTAQFFTAHGKGQVDPIAVKADVGRFSLEAQVYNHLIEQNDTFGTDATTCTVSDDTVKHIYYLKDIVVRDQDFQPINFVQWSQGIEQNIEVVFGKGFEFSSKLSQQGEKKVYVRNYKDPSNKDITDIIEISSNGSIRYYMANKKNREIPIKFERSILETYAHDLVALLIDPKQLSKKETPLTDFQLDARDTRNDLTDKIKKIPTRIHGTEVQTSDKLPYHVKVFLSYAGEFVWTDEDRNDVREEVYWVRNISVRDNSNIYVRDNFGEGAIVECTADYILEVNALLKEKTRLFMEAFMRLLDNDGMVITTPDGTNTYETKPCLKPKSEALEGREASVYFMDSSVKESNAFEFIPLTLTQIRKLANGLMYVLDRTLKHDKPASKTYI